MDLKELRFHKGRFKKASICKPIQWAGGKVMIFISFHCDLQTYLSCYRSQLLCSHHNYYYHHSMATLLYLLHFSFLMHIVQHYPHCQNTQNCIRYWTEDHSNNHIYSNPCLPCHIRAVYRQHWLHQYQKCGNKNNNRRVHKRNSIVHRWKFGHIHYWVCYCQKYPNVLVYSLCREIKTFQNLLKYNTSF